ncbi:MAG: hypothetical protein CMG00_01270 [Candidatus Marinimicrobia bacterium]|nr:hypothetical protein [Candidatus Neomarinimicrobiota bacterium]|tara:strand:+ start:771 stop:1691 length:921 start_codon:yes stop_codon:yes gene_type:complete
MNNYKLFNKKISYVFGFACITFIMLDQILPLSNNQNLATYLSFFLVSTIGIYHGAFDINKVDKISNYFNLKFFNFISIYILILVSVVTFWLLMPVFTLSLFLFISIHHFGADDYSYFNVYPNLLISITRGALIITLPLILNFYETVSILKILNFMNNTEYLTFLNSNYIIFAILLTANITLSFIYIRNYLNRIIFNTDMILLVIINYTLEPILAFTLYFCFLHSLRNISKPIFNRSKLVFMQRKKVIFISIITFMLFLFSFIFSTNFLNTFSALSTSIFIGLASLTFPHIVTEIVFNKVSQKQRII